MISPIGVQKAEAQASVYCSGFGWNITPPGSYTMVTYWNGGCSEVVAQINQTSYWYAYYTYWIFLAANPSIGFNTDS